MLSFKQACYKLSNYNTKLVTVYVLSKKKFNYLASHYEAQLQKTIPYLSTDEVKEKARSNLENIGAIYEYKDSLQVVTGQSRVSEVKAMFIALR